MSEYLLRRWLPDVEGSIKPTTYAGHKFMVDGYIVPALGSLRLRDLDPGHVNKLYRDLAVPTPASVAKVCRRSHHASSTSRCARRSGMP